MKYSQNNFNGDISFFDILKLFKVNSKTLIRVIFIFGAIGGLYGKLNGPVYEGKVLIMPATLSNLYVLDPKILLTKAEISSFYREKTLSACKPNHKPKNDLQYDITDAVDIALTKDGSLLSFSSSNKNKTIIKNCLEEIEIDVIANQNQYLKPLVEEKQKKLELLKSKFKAAEDLKNLTITSQLKNPARTAADILYTNILFNNENEMRNLDDQISSLTDELSIGKIREAGKVLPLDIKEKIFPSFPTGLILGLFLGLIFSIFYVSFKSLGHLK